MHFAYCMHLISRHRPQIQPCHLIYESSRTWSHTHANILYVYLLVSLSLSIYVYTYIHKYSIHVCSRTKNVARVSTLIKHRPLHRPYAPLSVDTVFGEQVSTHRVIKHTWVCLKIGYIPNYSHLIGIMIINHWV